MYSFNSNLLCLCAFSFWGGSKLIILMKSNITSSTSTSFAGGFSVARDWALFPRNYRHSLLGTFFGVKNKPTSLHGRDMILMKIYGWSNCFDEEKYLEWLGLRYRRGRRSSATAAATVAGGCCPSS